MGHRRRVIGEFGNRGNGVLILDVLTGCERGWLRGAADGREDDLHPSALLLPGVVHRLAKRLVLRTRARNGGRATRCIEEDVVDDDPSPCIRQVPQRLRVQGARP
jgi:hypothetical protein